MRKYLISMFLILLLACNVTLASAADVSLMMGFNGEEWLTSVGLEYSARKMVGFFGYQTDFASGMFGITNSGSEIHAYVNVGREAYIGAIKYRVAAHAGTARVDNPLDAANNLGVSGDYLQYRDNQGFGVSGEINLIGSPRVLIHPYIEGRDPGTWRVGVGIGSVPLYIDLQYVFDIDNQLEILASTSVDIDLQMKHELHFLFDQGLNIIGEYTNSGIGVTMNWEPPDNPMSFSISWYPEHVQWLVGYRIEI